MSQLVKGAVVWSFAVCMAACSVMEGTNVGVNIPIGGVVNVGANKTIGERPSSPKPNSQTEDEESSTEQNSPD